MMEVICKKDAWREKLHSLIKEKEESLQISVLGMTKSKNGDIHLLCHRASDESYIVWTTYRTGNLMTSFNGFYNGKYDFKSVKNALKEAQRRADKARSLPSAVV